MTVSHSKKVPAGFTSTVFLFLCALALGVGLYLLNTTYRAPSDVSGTVSEVMNKSYAQAKQVLAKEGWTVYVPAEFVSARVEGYPEIGDCGNGADAICSVNFRQNDLTLHLNVQIGGRAPYGPYSEWTVIGSE